MTLRTLHDRTPWWIRLLIPIILSVMLSGVDTYYHNDRDLVQRVTALESHRQDDNGRLDRIENKIDQLIGWALGK